MLRIAPLLACAALGGRVAAEPIAATEPPAREPAPPIAAPVAPHELTAADVASAPYPGDESGRTDEPDRDSLPRRAGRLALFPVRLGLNLGLAPVRGLLWAQDRYHLDELYFRAFYNADRTIGLYPTASYAAGYGFDAGAAFKDSEMFGRGETLTLDAVTGALVGDDYHESAHAAFHTGRRLGRVQVGVETGFERRPTDPFYGIGNADVAPQPAAAVDPRRDAAAVPTSYRYQEARAAAYADARITGALHVRALGTVTEHAFSRSTSDAAIDAVYDPAGLVGWPGFASAYGELEVRFDQRGRASSWEPAELHTEGWLVAAALGRSHRLDGGPDFWRGTAEVQQYLRLARGPRLLALRLRGEAVSGAVGEVPFSQLPTLGGGEFLRGYEFQRFRDRAAAVASVEYIWDLAHWVDAVLFVDAGRVYSSMSAIGVDRLRVGFGAAIRIFDESHFLCEVGVASSIDGGFFLNFSFNRVFHATPRWR